MISQQTLSPDYSQDKAWANKPDFLSHHVDVFYIYPTIYAEAEPLNMDIMNRVDLQNKAKGLTISQAGVYSESANLYAPHYRQISFKALNPHIDMFQNEYFKIGAGDIELAFDYYLKYMNTDRPFILASHSQGTLTAIELMRKKFNDKTLQKRLIAAYLIGYSLTSDDFEKYPWIKPAQKSDDTGVIISFNTQTDFAKGSPVLKKNAYCINPLNWKTDETPASPKENSGAVFFNDFTGEFIREKPNYTGAKINLKTGALECMPPDYKSLKIGHFPDGVLHKFDYSFWYRNLQKNVAERIKAYMKQKSCFEI